MIKIYYWAPFISKIATPKAVINSVVSIKKYSNKKFRPSIISLFHEWDSYNKKEYDLNFINLFKLKVNLKLPQNGFFLSRISFIIISLFSFFPLLRLLKKEKPEYLIIHLNTSLPLILLLIFNFKTKFILRISGNPKLNFFRKTLWRLVSKKIHMVTAPTYILSKKLSKHNIFTHDKLKVLYDPVLSIKDYKKKITMVNKYGKYLIAIGRLTKQKNFKFLINCFENLSKKYADYSLIILGEGDKKNELTKLINNKKLENKILLLGYKDNVSEYLKHSYCFVLSSLWEDPGFVLIESAMSNTLIFSSDCDTGPKDFLENEKNSFIYKTNDMNSFLLNFEKLMKKSDEEKYKIRVLMKKSIKKFTLFNHYKSLEKIIS